MAEHGSSVASNSAAEAEFLKEREQMLGGFVTFTTYGVIGVVALLVLMAIFLL